MLAAYFFLDLYSNDTLIIRYHISGFHQPKTSKVAESSTLGSMIQNRSDLVPSFSANNSHQHKITPYYLRDLLPHTSAGTMTPN